jgi:hypothetical protein
MEIPRLREDAVIDDSRQRGAEKDMAGKVARA